MVGNYPPMFPPAFFGAEETLNDKLKNVLKNSLKMYSYTPLKSGFTKFWWKNRLSPIKVIRIGETNNGKR